MHRTRKTIVMHLVNLDQMIISLSYAKPANPMWHMERIQTAGMPSATYIREQTVQVIFSTGTEFRS